MLLGALGWQCAPDPGPPQTGVVQTVLDGDTIILRQGRTVRYLGIDAPELGRNQRPPEFLARAAQDANARLVLNQELRLEYDVERYDQYGRLLAYVFLPDGRMVNAELVRQGLARVYLFPPNLSYQELLVTCQRRAIEARIGIWQRPCKAEERFYVGNRRSWRFHRPDCPASKKIAPQNRVILATPREAYLQGYSPCRLCRP